jgi:hypothetical protein
MSGVSIEERLELWASSLREVKARMRPLFTQARYSHRNGLRPSTECKFGWSLRWPWVRRPLVEVSPDRHRSAAV